MDILDPVDATLLWPNMLPQVRETLNRNGNMSELMLREIETGVFNGSVRAILTPLGFGIVTVDGDILMLLCYYGTIEEIHELAPDIKQMAQYYGATKIRIVGPRAWMRAFPALKEKCVVMEWEFEDAPRP